VHKKNLRHRPVFKKSKRKINIPKLDVTEESEVTEEPEEKNDFIFLLPYFGVPFFSLHAVMCRFLLNSLNLLRILVQ